LAGLGDAAGWWRLADRLFFFDLARGVSMQNGDLGLWLSADGGLARRVLSGWAGTPELTARVELGFVYLPALIGVAISSMFFFARIGARAPRITLSPRLLKRLPVLPPFTAGLESLI
jgi:hypothetical protein